MAAPGGARPAADRRWRRSRASGRWWSAPAPAIRPRCWPRSGCDVTALEVDAELAARGPRARASVVEGPLAAGHEAGAPYDLILIDGAVEHLPEAIIEQLADGGRLGAALIERRRHPADRRPQGRRRVRLSVDRAMPGSRRCPASQPAGVHISKGNARCSRKLAHGRRWPPR